MAGYLYFHKAPSALDLHKETVAKVKGLSKYDCLRANKTTAAWGVEARVPFLDQHFMDVAFAMDPKHKMCDASKGRIEKLALRKAFDTPEDPYLPESVLYRVKEAFSDGLCVCVCVCVCVCACVYVRMPFLPLLLPAHSLPHSPTHTYTHTHNTHTHTHTHTRKNSLTLSCTHRRGLLVD
jgi:Asparagine synthase